MTFAGGRPAGRFSTSRDILPGRTTGACINGIDVSKRGAPQLIDEPPAPILWSVRVPGADCIDLRGFTYGVTPAGFMVETPARPLAEGVRYELSIAAIGGVERYFVVHPGRSGAVYDPDAATTDKE